MRNLRVIQGAVLALASSVLLAPAALAAPAPGDASPTDPAVLDNTGAARFQIPIEVPPGPGGFAPRISLAYSSRSGDGPFGVGWSLGIPEIRCSERFGIPDLANCAKYELDNDILIENPTVPNEYHTFVESFRRIRFDPVDDSWTVELPNGTKLIFGEDAGHRISLGGDTARWLLQRMEDAFDNRIYLVFDTATDAGTAYLISMFYGAGASSTVGPREVRFAYEPRPDTRNVYSGGVARKLTRRLREIVVFGHGEVFKRYAFGYSSSSVTYTTDRSRLSWAQEFGTDCTDLTQPATNCSGLPRQEFSYRDSPGGYDVDSGYSMILPRLRGQIYVRSSASSSYCTGLL